MSRHGGRGFTSDAVLLTAPVGSSVVFKGSTGQVARHERSTASSRAHAVVGRAVVEALAVGLHAAPFGALRLTECYVARDVIPQDVCTIVTIVIATRARDVNGT